MARIFLSYASEQRSFADSINLSLLDRGHDVFFDKDDLPKGATFEAQIEKALRRSHLMIFVISPEAVSEGRFTLTELKLARRKWPAPGGRVLPVMAVKTPWEAVPSYLKAVSVLEPAGSPSAEVATAVEEMLRGKGRGGLVRGVAAAVVGLAVVAAVALNFDRVRSLVIYDPERAIIDRVAEQCEGEALYEQIAARGLSYSQAKELGERCASRLVVETSEGAPRSDEIEKFARDFALAATSEDSGERRAAAMVTQGDQQAAIESFLALARAASDPELRARHYRSAATLAHQGAPDKAIYAYEQLLEAEPDDLAAWSALMALYWTTGRTADVERAGRELTSRAERAGRLDWQGAAALQDATRLVSQGRFTEGKARLLEARRLYEQAGNRWGTAQSLLAEGELAVMQGDLQTASQRADDASAIGRNYNFKDVLAFATTLKGRAYFGMQDYDRADKLFREAAALNEEINNPFGLAFVVNQRGFVALNRNDPAEAKRLFEEVLEDNEALGNKTGVAWAHNSLAQVAQVRGDIEEAKAAYTRARDLFAEIGNPVGEGSSIVALANLETLQGRQDAALAMLDEAQRLAGEYDIFSLEAQTRIARAYIYQITEKPAEARTELEAVLEIHRQTQNEFGRLFVLEQLGMIARLNGDDDQARERWSRALELSRALGVPGTSRRLEYELSRLDGG